MTAVTFLQQIIAFFRIKGVWIVTNAQIASTTGKVRSISAIVNNFKA